MLPKFTPTMPFSVRPLGRAIPSPSVSGLLHRFHSPVPPLLLRAAHAKERGGTMLISLPFSSKEEDNAVFVPRIQRNYVR